MRILKRALFGLALASVFATTASVTSIAAPQESQFPDSDIHAALDAFDRCVQRRFVSTVPGFGLTRMVTMETLARPAHSTQHFSPASEAEFAAVQRFEALGLRVVMFLAGLQRPRLTTSGTTVVPASPVEGPVMVYPATPDGDTANPVSANLNREARESFEAFVEADSRSFAVVEWKFVAHPVRVPEKENCLGCHNARHTQRPNDLFQPGDAIGALLYGYQPLSAR